ncbi:MAG TPA: PAS domain-containing protein [Burkholderiales bacterium]|nr:PAS domain-containing protein [Burkholderiales bacterium]
MKRAWPIRWTLYLLVVATAAPLMLSIAIALVREAEEAETEARQLVLSLATTTAYAARAKLRDIEQIAASLARRPLVQAMDPAHCDPLLAALLPLFPRYANISVVAPDGHFVCSALPIGDRRKAPLHAGIRGALEGRFTVSEPLIGVLPQRLVISAGYPITRPGEGIVGVLTIPVDLASVKPASDPYSLPRNARVRIMAANGVLIASSVQDDPELGENRSEAPMLDVVLRGSTGTAIGKSLDGITRVYGYTDIGVNGWKAYAAVPVDALLAESRARTIQSLLIACTLLALALAAAALLARRIARPAAAIQRAMDETAAGRNTYAIEAGPLELRSLAANYNRMLGATLRAQAALQDSETRLRLAVRASNTGLWDWDVNTDRVYYSPEWKHQLGYADDEIGDTVEEWTGRLHPDDRERVVDEQRHLAARGESQYEAEFRLRHKNGTYRWIYTRAELIRDKTGAPRRMLGTHLDVTTRKSLEVALQQTVDDLRVLSRRLIEVEEAERRRIGRELHDRTGAHIAVLGITLGMAAEAIDSGNMEDAALELDKAREVLRECTADVRDLTTELRPAVLDDFGLYPALLAYARTVAQRIGAQLRPAGPPPATRASPVVETALFRIAQEALTNVAKHANAHTIELSLTNLDGKLVLQIGDDGQGFDPEAARGQGMRTMRERADAVGGTLAVHSSDGGGTRIIVEAPLA